MLVSERIKQLRIQNQMTQEELGEKIGVKKAAIQKYENGTVTNIKREKIKLIAKALNVTPSYLMGWEEFDTNNDVKAIALEAKVMDQIKNSFGFEARDFMIRFLQLNDLGKQKAIQYVQDLIEQPKFNEHI